MRAIFPTRSIRGAGRRCRRDSGQSGVEDDVPPIEVWNKIDALPLETLVATAGAAPMPAPRCAGDFGADRRGDRGLLPPSMRVRQRRWTSRVLRKSWFWTMPMGVGVGCTGSARTIRRGRGIRHSRWTRTAEGSSRPWISHRIVAVCARGDAGIWIFEEEEVQGRAGLVASRFSGSGRQRRQSCAQGGWRRARDGDCGGAVAAYQRLHASALRRVMPSRVRTPA